MILPKTDEPVPKPRTKYHHPNLTRYPHLFWWRKIFRLVVYLIVRLLIWLFIELKVYGRDNLPVSEPFLLVVNHLGDADPIIGLAIVGTKLEGLSKIELYNYPVIGWLMNNYGVIWVHRGQPDRKAIRIALQLFDDGKAVGIAPEGRESTTGALENGTSGAAYLAIKGNVPIVPMTFIGTENKIIYKNLLKLKKSKVRVTIGKPFQLSQDENLRLSLDNGTRKIMEILASQLPPEYRGVYNKDTQE